MPAWLTRILGHWLFSAAPAVVLAGLGIEQLIAGPEGEVFFVRDSGLYRGIMLLIAAAHAGITALEARHKLGKFRDGA